MRGFRSLPSLSLTALLASIASAPLATAQERGDELKPAPNRRPDEGKGPFKTLVIRGGMLIDGGWLAGWALLAAVIAAVGMIL